MADSKNKKDENIYYNTLKYSPEYAQGWWNRTIEGPYWPRYREYLKKLDWKDENLEELNRSTDGILHLLGDPVNKDHWDVRGMVVGDVQSGKTSNYTGLICKCVDAGYRLIIVLTSNFNSLRYQTQIRLDEGFLGFESMASDKTIGAGFINKIFPRPLAATNTEDDFDDFPHAGDIEDGKSCLFVCKKNPNVLDSLIEWVGERDDWFKELPLLVIDDEADNASLAGNQGKKKDSSDNKTEDVDGSCQDTTAINCKIRTILNKFHRKSFVGYTATPFANMFVSFREEGGKLIKEIGKDLFPKDFILNLHTPPDYFGLAKLFGPLPFPSDDEDEKAPEKGLPLIRDISPDKTCAEEDFKESLQKAVISFLLACAARSLRGQKSDICSMMIHPAMKKYVHEQWEEQLQGILKALHIHLQEGKWKFEPVDKDTEKLFKEIWEKDFIRTSQEVKEMDPASMSMIPDAFPEFEQVWRELPAVVERIDKILLVNGDSDDVVPQPIKAKPNIPQEKREPGKIYFFVGGNMLSRGLTLPGLITSYFLRDSKYADSLLQMARWFGYRNGYLDLCRIYTTKNLVSRFRGIYESLDDLREQFDLAAANNKTPTDYAYSLSYYPDLVPTGRMGVGIVIQAAYSGRFMQTLNFLQSCKSRKKNYDSLIDLIKHMGTPNADYSGALAHVAKRAGNKALYIWENVAADKVCHFLSAYQSSGEAREVKAERLAHFIKEMNNEGELVKWRVALAGLAQKGNPVKLTDDISIIPTHRTVASIEDDSVAIKVLTSPKDESIALDSGGEVDEYQEALRKTIEKWENKDEKTRSERKPEFPQGAPIREINGIYHRDRGLLLLYLLDIADGNGLRVDKCGENEKFFVGYAISFPNSENAKVIYGSADYNLINQKS